MKITTCSMSVNLEQTDGAGTGEVSPPPHPGRSAAAISVAAIAAPILSNSRRVTFLDSMGSFLPLLSLRCTGEADRPDQLPMSGLDVRPTGGPCPPRFMSGRARLTRTLGRRDDHRREDQLPPYDWHGRDRRLDRSDHDQPRYQPESTHR